MSPVTAPRTGAEVLVDQLALNAVETIFAVTGESYLAVTDALCEHEQIQLYSCRHEGGAAFMAEATGKLTGRPGICLVTRGPGATNASIGVHTAFQDSTPMILLVGQVARSTMGREGFQELDYVQVFSGLAKMGGTDRRRRTDPRDHAPCLHHRDFRAPRPGRHRLAAGHARRRRHRWRRSPSPPETLPDLSWPRSCAWSPTPFPSTP